MLEALVIEQARRASIVDVRPAPAHITETPKWARPVTPECIVAEASRQSMELIKLLSVMKAESGRVGQFVRNSNGSYDIGPMQINTIHIADLAKTFRVSDVAIAQLIAYDGCFNVSVGAWILRQRTNEAGGDFWYGIGRYHSKTKLHSTNYILRVHSVMEGIVRSAKLAVAKSRSNGFQVNLGASFAASQGD